LNNALSIKANIHRSPVLLVAPLDAASLPLRLSFLFTLQSLSLSLSLFNSIITNPTQPTEAQTQKRAKKPRNRGTEERKQRDYNRVGENDAAVVLQAAGALLRGEARLWLWWRRRWAALAHGPQAPRVRGLLYRGGPGQFQPRRPEPGLHVALRHLCWCL
jgi:hypothetical protein